MTQPTDAAERVGAAPAVDWARELATHERWLRTVLFARLGDAQAVDDVFQEVALAAVRQKAPVADPLKVAPWLYRVAATQALMYRRKCGRARNLHRRYAERQSDHPPHASREADPLEWLVLGERRELLQRGLARLPSRDREMLLLKYGEDWSYSQLAVHLGLTHSAVEARLHRARRKLRDELTAAQAIEVA